jgi:two-component system, OmpR family, response regulator
MVHTGETGDDHKPAPRVLMIDDDPELTEIVSTSLEFSGYLVTSASNGTDAMRALSEPFDAVILDVMLPGLDGFEVVQLIRGRYEHIPVLFLTARNAVEDRVRGLRLGGDDYLTKPFSMAELLARMDALIRRAGSGGPPQDVLQVGDLRMDRSARRLTRGAEPISLSPTEFRLTEYLMVNAGHVMSKSQIMEEVWGYDFGGDGNVVERFVSSIRRKVDGGHRRRLLHTVRGFGYTLDASR